MKTPAMKTQAMNPQAPALAAHHPFITQQLPAWLNQAPADLRQDFRDCLLASNQSRHAMKALLDELKSPQDFARPLLRDALTTQFFGLLEGENALLVREWKHHHLLGVIKNHAKTTRQTLLEAALQNFEASETVSGGMEAGTGLFNVSKNGEVLTQASPAEFAGMCRSLDLGGKYLDHLNEVLEPPSATVGARTAAQVADLLRNHERHAFGVALHIAYMKQQFTPREHLQLHTLQRSGRHMHIRCSHLSIDNVILPNVLVIQAGAIGIPFLLYTPEDPLLAFRRHTTLADLQHSLAERLLGISYPAFFRSLVPLQHRETLLKVQPAGTHTADRAHMDKTVSHALIQGDTFQAMATQRIAQFKSDAGTLAVPTAAADLLSRQKRLQSYLDLGKSLLFFAASFIPVVGQVMLAVSAAQLIGTVYDGFAAWSRGDSDEALNDLLDVVDNVALAAATAGAIKTVGFTAGLVKVQVRNRGWRLWNPDLTPYRQPMALPDALAADSQGVYQHEQQRYLKLDDQLHALEPTPDGKQWHLTHPTDPVAYSPALLNNTVGGWRSVHETPSSWDNLKLVKRLGPDAINITQPAVEPLLLLGGADRDTLIRAHEEMVRPPPLLRDTVKRFNLNQEIENFNIERAEGKSVTAHSPLIQFHLVCSLPEWPANRQLKIVDEQQIVVISHGTGTAETVVPASRFKNGELLHALESQLPQEEFNNLLPTPYIDYFSKVENLAVRLHEEVPRQKQRLFTLLHAPGEKPVTPTEKDLHALIPELPKSHLEEITTVLRPQERQQLQEQKRLPPEQQWEATQYLQAIRANRARESIYLNSVYSPESVQLMLSGMEQLAGWPGAHKIEVYDRSRSGVLLGSIGTARDASSHTLVRQGELYAAQDAQGENLHPPCDMFSAVEYTLPAPERTALLSQNNATSLKQAVQDSSLSLLARRPAYRASAVSGSGSGSGRPLDPLFAEPVRPDGMSLHVEGVFKTAPLADGSYRYYIQNNGKYYRVKSDSLGWQLIDARSPFRAYKPYVHRNPEGDWEIDPAKGALLGGMYQSQVPLLIRMESSDEFESAQSSSDYESADESIVTPFYTPQEMSHMRTQRNYQHSHNYLRIYDRANNGRYPLRDLYGRPMRIKSLQTRSRSLTSNETFSSDLIKPYIQWEGYERVARLYEDKLEVTPFTAAHQKFAEESALIDQSTVITRKPIKKGEALGVYGGELIPHHVAAYRQDPYLLDIKPMPPPPAAPPLTLSGDNVLSRINTIFEYDAGRPVRQAATGYNVEAARFDVDTQVGNHSLDRVSLMALFASEDIPAATELRWNYQYNEATIRALFSDA